MEKFIAFNLENPEFIFGGDLINTTRTSDNAKDKYDTDSGEIYMME